MQIYISVTKRKSINIFFIILSLYRVIIVHMTLKLSEIYIFQQQKVKFNEHRIRAKPQKTIGTHIYGRILMNFCS